MLVVVEEEEEEEVSIRCEGRGAREHVPCPLLRVHRSYPGSEGKVLRSCEVLWAGSHALMLKLKATAASLVEWVLGKQRLARSAVGF